MKLEEVTRRFWEQHSELQDSKDELKSAICKIMSLENERDFYEGMYNSLTIEQKRKWHYTLHWLYKREMLGWCIAAALSIVWFFSLIILI